MKTLLIDDMPETKAVKADVVAKSYEEGIEALKTQGPFDVLYLDHDLGDEDPHKSGYSIMCFLEANLKYLPGSIVCVSRNPSGRRNIEIVINKLYGRDHA
jgi:hypothetical protein